MRRISDSWLINCLIGCRRRGLSLLDWIGGSLWDNYCRLWNWVGYNWLLLFVVMDWGLFGWFFDGLLLIRIRVEHVIRLLSLTLFLIDELTLG